MDKLEKLIYNASLSAHYLEQRIAKLETVTALDEETAAMEEKIKQLQAELESRNKTGKTLQSMIEQFLVSAIYPCTRQMTRISMAGGN